MVQHTNHAGLIELYFAIPGAPWKWETWKTLTGVHHGLFPEDPKQIPSPMTPRGNKAIKTYFDAYRGIKSIEERHQFASKKRKDSYNEGREHWRTFVTTNWRRWKIQLKIHEAFFANGITYIQILVDNNLASIPPTIAVSHCFDTIAYELFGEDGLTDSGMHKQPLIKPLHIFTTNASFNLRKTSKALIERTKEQGAVILSQLDDLAGDKEATEADLRDLAKLVVAWKRGILVWNTKLNLDTLADVEDNIYQIGKGLGAHIRLDRLKASGRGKRETKVKASMFEHLAQSSEVCEVIGLLEDLFAADTEVPELCGPAEIGFGERDEDGRDPGVAHESTMSYVDICSNLGLDDHGRLPLFNEYQHSSKESPWSKAGKKLFAKYDRLRDDHPHASEFSPSKLHYHQLAGMHAVLRQMLGSKKTALNPMGFLIADSPGLGKTRMSAAVAIWLITCGWKQDIEAPALPPLLTTKPLFGNTDAIPDCPTLIIAPGTLANQWVEELQCLVKPNSVEILPYPASSKADRKRFWSEGGLYTLSEHRSRNKIIIANQSTLFAEYKLLYRTGKDTNARSKKAPWESPDKLRTFATQAPFTLFGLKFLVVILDEAHFCRNPGLQHSAAIAIAKNSHSRLILTATPLQTRTEDVGAMGRLCNIDHFYSQKYADEVADDAADLRRARADGNEELITKLQGDSSRRMQVQFEGRLICRRATSLDFEGNPLLSLPECTTVLYPIYLQEWEQKLIDANITDESIDSIAMAQLSGFQTESCYSNERLMCTFPRENTKDPVPRITSMRAWEKMGNPTKVTATAKLAAYLLSGDDVPIPKPADGEITIPEYTPDPSATRKVLVYQEFTVFTQLLLDVLRCFKVDAVNISGSMSFKVRMDVVRKFQQEAACRCLVFSKVGAVGLNLTEADCLIFLDQQWSYADDVQAVGRLHRQGQTRPVTVFHMLAAGTVDYYMAATAGRKAVMAEAFTTTEQAERLAGILAGGDPGLGEDDDGDSEGGQQSTSSKAPKTSTSKTSASTSNTSTSTSMTSASTSRPSVPASHLPALASKSSTSTKKVTPSNQTASASSAVAGKAKKKKDRIPEEEVPDSEVERQEQAARDGPRPRPKKKVQVQDDPSATSIAPKKRSKAPPKSKTTVEEFDSENQGPAARTGAIEEEDGQSSNGDSDGPAPSTRMSISERGFQDDPMGTPPRHTPATPPHPRSGRSSSAGEDAHMQSPPPPPPGQARRERKVSSSSSSSSATSSSSSRDRKSKSKNKNKRGRAPSIQQAESQAFKKQRDYTSPTQVQALPQTRGQRPRAPLYPAGPRESSSATTSTHDLLSPPFQHLSTARRSSAYSSQSSSRSHSRSHSRPATRTPSPSTKFGLTKGRRVLPGPAKTFFPGGEHEDEDETLDASEHHPVTQSSRSDRSREPSLSRPGSSADIRAQVSTNLLSQRFRQDQRYRPAHPVDAHAPRPAAPASSSRSQMGSAFHRESALFAPPARTAGSGAPYLQNPFSKGKSDKSKEKGEQRDEEKDEKGKGKPRDEEKKKKDKDKQ